MGCRFGNKCYLSHDNPNSIRLCPLLQSAAGCQYGKMCYDRHEVHSDDIAADKLKQALSEKEDVFMVEIKKQLSSLKNVLYRHHASSQEMLTKEQKAGISSKCKATLLTAANALDKLQEELADHSKTRKLLYQDVDKPVAPNKRIKHVADGVVETNPFLGGDGTLTLDKGNGVGLDKENVNGQNLRKRRLNVMADEGDRNGSRTRSKGVAVATGSMPLPKRLRVESSSGSGSGSDASIETKTTFEFDG